jgi:hypothetical protein
MYMVIRGFDGLHYRGYIPKYKMLIVGDNDWLFYNGKEVCQIGSGREKEFLKKII